MRSEMKRKPSDVRGRFVRWISICTRSWAMMLTSSLMRRLDSHSWRWTTPNTSHQQPSFRQIKMLTNRTANVWEIRKYNDRIACTMGQTWARMSWNLNWWIRKMTETKRKTTWTFRWQRNYKRLARHLTTHSLAVTTQSTCQLIHKTPTHLYGTKLTSTSKPTKDPQVCVLVSLHLTRRIRIMHQVPCLTMQPRKKARG